jgi:hypothetical protein
VSKRGPNHTGEFVGKIHPESFPAYFTNIGIAGPVRSGQLPGSIGVLESLDKPMPIEIASEVGRTERGLAVWSLRVRGADVPGRWVIIDRRFVAVENDPV